MPNAKLSHLEIVVSSIPDVEPFYTSVLGFAVTDRSEGSGDGSMVFLSQDPDEHHQLVLRQSSGESVRDHLDHIAFRLDTLAELREVLAAARDAGIDRIETVSHGSTWSVYVPDPEGNRIEHFVDTPWAVTQPCRFDVDLDVDDEALAAATEARIRDLGPLT
jgi:catechol 2,3-dioxygenase